MTGYLHPRYAESFIELGTPRELPQCSGWILVRQVPGFPYYDAMGCYPIFTCRNWAQLLFDLDNLGKDLVSLALVTDPFGAYDEAYLRRCFKDVVVPLKDHLIADLSLPINRIVSKHHRYYARKALESVYVERCETPTDFLEDWQDLYATLTSRHSIKGIQAFSRAAFAKQLSIPGLVMFRAISHETTVGAHLWYLQGEIAYSHLAAFSSVGYDLMASYALYWRAIEYFTGKISWLDLGAGTGIKSDSTDGLSQFKRGWSTGKRTAYFCGRIFEREKYEDLVEAKRNSVTNYFPAYRQGEFGY